LIILVSYERAFHKLFIGIKHDLKPSCSIVTRPQTGMGQSRDSPPISRNVHLAHREAKVCKKN